MSLQDITITSSINSYPTLSYGQKTYIASTDQESFPIETIDGGQAGVWPNFDGQYATTNLFVNISQSWFGSNVTSLGIVPFVHDTEEEFLNGEFSGSNYVVSDGNLNDAQRQQFLQINTTIVNYKIFPFYKNNTIDAFNVYINRNTAPNPGEVYIYFYNFTGAQVRGLYAKIAKVDADGNDNTLSLQELKQFNYVDTNPSVGKITFDVLNINEYSDYYFYEVKTQDTTALPFSDNRYLHSLSASYSASSLPSTTGLGFLVTPILSSSYGSWKVLNDSLNYFNTSGKYIFGDTPNIELKFTASFKYTVASPVTAAFGMNEYIPDAFSYTPYPYGVDGFGTGLISHSAGTYTKVISGSGFFTNVKNYIGSLAYYSDQILTNVTASFIITQSATPQTSTNFFILEPYLTSDFNNSDSDVLINNYSENDYSHFYREVLYDDGGTTPSNFQQIISGTAQFAEVNDYLFNAHANTLPRYSGVRTTSAGFNLPSTNGFSNEYLANILTSNALIINNGTPNVEQTTTYFAYFDNLKANWPIFKNTTSPVVKYLIREDGTTFNPATDEATYYNMLDSFSRGTKAYTNLLSNTTLVFNSTQSILLSGESYKPILYTISASTATTAYFSNPVALNFINLSNPGSNPQSYNFSGYGVFPTSYAITAGSTINIFYKPGTGLVEVIQYDTSSGFNTSGTPGDLNYPSFEFQYVPQNSVNIECGGNIKSTTTNSNVPSSYKFNLWLERGATSQSLGEQTGAVYGSTINGRPNNAGTNLKIVKNDFFAQPGDIIYVTLENLGPSSIVFYLAYPRLKITTNVNVPGVSGPGLWTTGSANDTVITSSLTLGEVLQGNYIQEDIAGSGFDPIEVPCEIFPGDEIRFEYDETLSYKVLDVLSTSSAGGIGIVTYLTLDRSVPSYGINLDHFTVRRKVKDYITGITLDNNLITPIQAGFLLPEYPSETIKKNLPNIVNDLYNRTLI